MTSKFFYQPDVTLLRNKYNKIAAKIEQMKKYLENEIKSQFPEMGNIRLGIYSRQMRLNKFVENATNENFEAFVNHDAFKRIAK
jgi:hypothetical protein